MGSVGAADMARGVGNGLGVVRTVRVIALQVYMNKLVTSPCSVIALELSLRRSDRHLGNRGTDELN